MKERPFIKRRQPEWQAWDRWLKPDKVPPAVGQTIAAAELAHRFRRLCHDLALVRDREYSAAIADDLHRRVLAVHQRIYGAAQPTSDALLRFVGGDFPRLVRDEWRVVLSAAALFFLPLLLTVFAIPMFPDAVLLFLSEDTIREVEAMYAPTAAHLGRPLAASDEWAMWGFYVAHNVRIDFQAFAGGIAFAVGTVFYLLYNALFLGAIAGHLTQIGLGEAFWGFVAGHSAFELCGAVLSGAAGLKIGGAMLAPGRRTRLAALAESSRIAIRLVYGAVALTFLAAFIEAFWSPSREVSTAIKIGIGALLWLLTLAYLGLAGRRTHAR